jgi:hypothetical protein
LNIRPAWRYLILAMSILALGSCQSRDKRLNRLVTLWRKDRIPYGAYFAYENMKYMFPKANITINSSSPADYRSFHYTRTSRDKQPQGYIIIAPQVIPDQNEINAMMNFVGDGNQLFISSFLWGDSLLSSLGIKLGGDMLWTQHLDSLQVSVYEPATDSLSIFRYPGARADNYVRSMDTQYATILGRNVNGMANFVKFSYKGGGSIYLHFAPMAFTNFFLLHKNNVAYYEAVFSYLPSSLKEVKWDDYFRYAKDRNFSALQYILANRSLRWAFWLVLVLFGLIFLFESKRRQRLIPVMTTVRNSSLDFVKTIGRLYFQQRDHSNLAAKMTAHWLDFIRTNYHLSTSTLDEEFISRVSFKAGLSRDRITSLVQDVRYFQDNASPSDEDLLSFGKKIDDFYKKR